MSQSRPDALLESSAVDGGLAAETHMIRLLQNQKPSVIVSFNFYRNRWLK